MMPIVDSGCKIKHFNKGTESKEIGGLLYITAESKHYEKGLPLVAFYLNIV